MNMVSSETEIQAYLANFYLVFARSTFAQTLKNVLGEEGARLDELSEEIFGCGAEGWGAGSVCTTGYSHLELSPSPAGNIAELHGEQRYSC